MADRIFITGSTGFVGANLTRLLLDRGHPIRALARPSSDLTNLRDLIDQGLDIEVLRGDLTDPDLADKMAGCRYCFHVAAHYSLWQRDRAQLHASNVQGTRNILAAAQKAGIERTVYTSSVAAIGVPSDGSLGTEQYQSPPERLIGDYKKSKYWAEQEALQAAQAGQNVVIVNPSTPIGPWDVKPTPTGDIILRFLQRKMPAYVETGLNLIDVRDVALGHLLALEKGQAGERYILGHQNTSLKQLLELLSDITGMAAPKTTVPLWLPLGVAWMEEKVLAKLGYEPTVPIDGVRMSAQRMYYDSSKAVRELGYQPTVPIDGVRMSAQRMYYDPSKAVRELGLPQSPIGNAVADAVEWFRRNGYVN